MKWQHGRRLYGVRHCAFTMYVNSKYIEYIQNAILASYDVLVAFLAAGLLRFVIPNALLLRTAGRSFSLSLMGAKSWMRSCFASWSSSASPRPGKSFGKHSLMLPRSWPCGPGLRPGGELSLWATPLIIGPVSTLFAGRQVLEGT
jgi:hypothetical protein